MSWINKVGRFPALITIGVVNALAAAAIVLVVLWLFDAAIYVECGPDEFLGGADGET